MAIFFTSDEHYGHCNIIDFCKRPFTSLDEMRETIITRHNERVKQGDLVYHVGDMFWRTIYDDEAHYILDKLNGEHYYIRGNHEEVLDKNPSVAKRFIWVKDYKKIRCKPFPPIVLFHYAMRVWEQSHHGSWHLYGHSHGDLPEDSSLSFDVGVDAWDFYPVALEQVAVKMFEKANDKAFKYLLREQAADKQIVTAIANDLVREYQQ